MGEPTGTPDDGSPDLDPRVLRTVADDRMRLDPTSRTALRGLNRVSRRSGRLSPRRYNLTVSHEHRFVWFRVAKAGTRTIFGHLVDCGVELDLSHAMRIRYPVEPFADYYKFAFVRDPLDRLVSAWLDKVVDNNYYRLEPDERRRLQSLEAFVEWVAGHDLSDVSTVDQHLVLQTRAVDLTQVDLLGRLESFTTDFATVCRHLGLPDTVGRSRNVSAVRTAARASSAPREVPDRVPDEVSDEVRERVRELYRLDYQILGYPTG